MNILDIGVDIIEIYRIKELLDKNPRFLEKMFTSKEIELGKPIVKTYNNFKQICIDYNVSEIKVSISHCKDYAVANSIAITKEG